MRNFLRVALVLLAGSLLSGCVGPGMLAFPEQAETRVQPFTKSFDVTEVGIDFTRLYYQFGLAGLRADGANYDRESGGMAPWFERKIEARARSTGAVGGDGEPVEVVVAVNQYSMTERHGWLVLCPNLIPTLSLWSIFGGMVAAYHVEVDVVFSATCGQFTKDYPYKHDSSSWIGFYYGLGNWPGIHMAPLVDRFVADLASDLKSGAPSPSPTPTRESPAAEPSPQPEATSSQPLHDGPLVATDDPRDYVFVAALGDDGTPLAYICPAGFFREHGRTYDKWLEDALRLNDLFQGWYEADMAMIAPSAETSLEAIHDQLTSAGFVYDRAFADHVAKRASEVHRPR